MPANKIPSNRPPHQQEEHDQQEEELAAEVTATNEGMPAGEIDEEPKDAEEVQSPETFDAEARHDNSAASVESKHPAESKGAAAGE